MFNTGDLVVYNNNGVCRVEDITTPTLANANQEKLYYVLKNLNSNGMAYVPTDSTVYMRPVMSKREADALVSEIPNVSISAFSQLDAKSLLNRYKEIISSHDNKLIISMIKFIEKTRAEKQALKKKLSLTEERYLEQARNIIESEISVVLDIPREKTREYILSQIPNGE